jgi:thiol-disulfide isomerase/thioredoxin
MRFYRWVVVALVLLGTVGVRAGESADEIARKAYWGNEEDREQHFKMLGKAAPELALTEWRGKAVTAAEMKGKIVVVDFWATWCPPCKRAVPHHNEIAKKYADRGVLMVGACGGGQEERMNAFADETKMEYPTGKASEAVAKAWGMVSPPHYVIVDRKGIVRAVGIRPEAIEKVVEALLEEK